MAEYIKRDDALRQVMMVETRENMYQCVKNIPAADVLPIPDGGIGEVSDGYHTFNGLYYQRMVLFATLVKQNKDKAWKSFRHEDGELCFGGGWFIVGIDTPSGSYTYHYDDNFWSMFDCQELPVAKHWDGHTEKDVTRLLSLADVKPVKHGVWIDIDDSYYGINYRCSVCDKTTALAKSYDILGNEHQYPYCPRCGAKMDGEDNG